MAGCLRPSIFVDFGIRGAVDVALSRLVRAGSIRRIGRGLYDYPRQYAKLGALSPDVTILADAVSVQTGDRVAPSGAVAVNGFGLSTQVPARASFATNGPTRVKKVGGRSLTLRHSRVPVLNKASDAANSVLQGLAHLGKGRIDDDVIARFASRIDDRDMKTLLNARDRMARQSAGAAASCAPRTHKLIDPPTNPPDRNLSDCPF